MSEMELALGIDQEQPDDTLSVPEPTKQGGANGQKGSDPPPEVDVKALRKQMESLEARLAEKAESEGYLRQMVEKLAGGQKAAPAKQEEDDDPLKGMDPAKFVDILTEQGPGGLRKAGFLTKADLREAIAAVKEELRGAVREEVDSTVKSLGKSASLAQKHPDLNDPESDLSQRVKEIYKELVDDEPEAAGKRSTWAAAVRAAAAELKAAAPPAKPKQDRVEFLRRVSPERSTRGGEMEIEEVSDDVSKMLSGLGVKPEQFAKQRKAMGGSR